MKTILVMIALCIACAPADAKTVSNDMISYTAPPKTWKKEVKEHHYTEYTIIDQTKKIYCRITVLTGDNSHGAGTADFDHEWKNTILSAYTIPDPPQLTETVSEDGWEARAGVATFQWNGGTSMMMLTTITGYGRTVSIIANTNSEEYAPVIQTVLSSVKMTKIAPAKGEKATPAKASSKSSEAKPQALQGYMEYSPFTQTWTWRLRTPYPQKK